MQWTTPIISKTFFLPPKPGHLSDAEVFTSLLRKNLVTEHGGKELGWRHVGWQRVEEGEMAGQLGFVILNHDLKECWLGTVDPATRAAVLLDQRVYRTTPPALKAN